MPRTAGKQPKPKTGGGLRESRFILIFSFFIFPFLWNLSGTSAGLNALARASKDWETFRSREKPLGSVYPPYWILTVKWSGARSCLFDDVTAFTYHRFLHPHYKTAFTKSIVFNSLHSGERLRIAPFSVIVFGVSSVDHSRIRSKTAPFSFDNGLVRTGPQINYAYVFWRGCVPSGSWRRIVTRLQ